MRSPHEPARPAVRFVERQRPPEIAGKALAVALAAAVATACINSTVPLAPQCTAAIAIELSTEQISPGDTFVATAIHRGDECLSNLSWTADGVISFRSAEGHSATFHADASGSGRIRVINDNGNLGVIDVAVEESEEQGASRSD